MTEDLGIIPVDPNDYVEFFTDNAGEYRWHYRAGNNENMADSGEGYKELADAVTYAERVTRRSIMFDQDGATFAGNTTYLIRGVLRDSAEG